MALRVIRPEDREKERRRRRKRTGGAEGGRRASRTLQRRMLVLMLICLLVGFVPVTARLYQLMVVEHDQYEELAIRNQTRNMALPAQRGVIYDRNMNVLAASTTVETVFIDPNMIEKKMTDKSVPDTGLLDRIAAGLSEILEGVTPEFVREQAADTKYQYKVIAKKVTEEVADQVRAFIDENNIVGVNLESDAKRYYPYSSLAAQVLGFISEDNQGTEGIESYYDSFLQGTSGKIVTTRGNGGTQMLYTYEKYYDASDGDSLVLTLDTSVQYMLEKNLENAIAKYDIRNGAFGIVMDVNTGGILAMATLGSYDPNNHLEIYDQTLEQELERQYQNALALRNDTAAYEQEMAAYNAAVATARLRQWRNRCVSDGYEPGSTFKLVTLAMGLDCGAFTTQSSYFCGGKEDFQGRDQTLSCWKTVGHGTQTTGEALGNSCNIALAHMGLQIGGNRFYDYVSSFGFLEKSGVDLPGEASGYFFARDQLNGASTASLISASFGQTFRITPMQLVRAVAAIVNGGYLLEPHIVSQIVDADENVVQENSRTVVRQVISEQTSATMRDLMERVVTEGTAKSARTPGYRVGGKTGTSEKIDTYDEDGNPVEDKIVSFIGVAPINDPQYVVLVALDTPDYIPGTSYTPNNYYISGGLMAAPTVRDVFSDILPYLGIEPDYTAEDICGVNVTMPETVGMTEQEAAEALQKKSLTYRVVGDGAVVTDQIPAATAEVPGNSEVVLYMGAEKPTSTVTVPDFVGYAPADVNWLANNAGVYVQAKGTNLTENYVTVTYQDIPAGTEVERGTTITMEFTDHTALD
mgnify:FL=1